VGETKVESRLVWGPLAKLEGGNAVGNIETLNITKGK
jgi:hypothetical protein